MSRKHRREVARETLSIEAGMPAPGESIEEPELDEKLSPSWIGWVYAADGVNGYRRCKVRVPEAVLELVQDGEPSGPDLRPTLVQLTVMDSMTDAFLIELAEEAKKR